MGYTVKHALYPRSVHQARQRIVHAPYHDQYAYGNKRALLSKKLVADMGLSNNGDAKSLNLDMPWIKHHPGRADVGETRLLLSKASENAEGRNREPKN